MREDELTNLMSYSIGLSPLFDPVRPSDLAKSTNVIPAKAGIQFLPTAVIAAQTGFTEFTNEVRHDAKVTLRWEPTFPPWRE
jgi:hypothetical protein